MYIPLLRNNIPRRATACGLPHYQVEPVYNPDTESTQPPAQQEDRIENYIRESEADMGRELSNSDNRVISSGSYNN